MLSLVLYILLDKIYNLGIFTASPRFFLCYGNMLAESYAQRKTKLFNVHLLKDIDITWGKRDGI